jgi:hypothetical protein
MGEGYTQKFHDDSNGHDGLSAAPSTGEYKLPTYGQIVDADSAAEYGGEPSSGVLGRPEQAAPDVAADKAREASLARTASNATLPQAWTESAVRDQLTVPVRPEQPPAPREKQIGDSDKRGYPPVIG